MRQLFWDAINPHSVPPGQPYLLDDPNLFFGPDGLGYAREPGDPGFVPYGPAPLSPVLIQPKRKPTMAKSDYVKNRDADFAAQLAAFQLNIGTHAAALGLTPAQLTAQAADAAYYAYLVQCQDVAANHAQQWTAWRDQVRDGGGSALSSAPEEVLLPTPVPAVPPGIEARFRALVRQIKAHPTYSTAIGELLGIEGPTSAPLDPATLKPQISLEPQGGHVFIRWGWQGHRQQLQMIEICVDRGDGQGFVFLAQDTTPNYLDTTPPPATPTKWTYKAIYRADDQRTGLWSDEVSLTVGG